MPDRAPGGAASIPARAPAMPSGPWVLVVGMHRSGTSAVTGALGRLGLAVPVREDRWDATADNPDYWESAALGLYNEALLERLGGRWDGPPDCGPGWESDPALAGDGLGGDPAAAAATAFPRPGPLVWKDPRLCILLPFWLALLPRPVAAVFVWRGPLPVARSLQARDGMHLADGVALWERYNRAGLTGLVGVDTFVVRYESIVADPPGRLGELGRWLGELPQLSASAGSWDLSAPSAAISPQLQRQHDADDASLLLGEQRSLVARLESLEGPHRPLSSPLRGGESPWTTALLGDRLQLVTLSRERDALQHGLADEARARQALQEQWQEARAELERTRDELAGQDDRRAQMESSISWRVTGPLRRLGAWRRRKRSLPVP